MSKSGVKVINVAARTINLAKEPMKKKAITCMLPPATQTTHIKVCTPDQLRFICPPDPCVCPDPLRPMTGGERFLKFFVFVSKTIFLISFIKWTVMLGIWGDISSTSELMCDGYKKLAPALSPKSSEGGESSSSEPLNLATLWNKTVAGFIYVVGVLPTAACSKMFALINKPNEEPPPPPPPPPAKKK